MILPYNVDRPARLTPTVTYGLMAANILVYVLTTGYTNYKMYTERPEPAPSFEGRVHSGRSSGNRSAESGRGQERVAALSGYGFARSQYGSSQSAQAQHAGLGFDSAQAGAAEEVPRAVLAGGYTESLEERSAAIAEMEKLSKTPEGRSQLWDIKREAWNREHAKDALALDTHPDVMSWLAYLTVAPSLLTIFTSMFLHGDLLHLMGNMLFLWVFGRAVEDTLGRGIYLSAYFLCGLAAVMLYHIMAVATMPGVMIPCMGASGAIMGVLGLFAPRFYRTPVRLFYTNFHGARIFYLGTAVLGALLGQGLGLGASGASLAALLVLGGIVIVGDETLWGEWTVAAAWIIGAKIVLQDLAPALLQMATGAMGGGTAHWAHIGGFLCGVAYAFLIGSHKEGKSEYLVDDARHSLDLKYAGNALEKAQQLVMMKPEDPVGYQLLAEAHERKENPELALENYKLALDKYLRRGERSQAAKLYQDALVRHPEWVPEAPTLFTLASQMAKDGDWKGAGESLAKLPYYYPQASEGEMAFLRAAQIYHERLDQPVVAMQLLHEFGNRFPQSPWMEKATALYNTASQNHSGAAPS